MYVLEKISWEHKSIKTTLICTHLTDPAKRKIKSQLDNLLNFTPTNTPQQNTTRQWL